MVKIKGTYPARPSSGILPQPPSRESFRRGFRLQTCLTRRVAQLCHRTFGLKNLRVEL